MGEHEIGVVFVYVDVLFTLTTLLTMTRCQTCSDVNVLDV